MYQIRSFGGGEGDTVKFTELYSEQNCNRLSQLDFCDCVFVCGFGDDMCECVCGIVGCSFGCSSVKRLVLFSHPSKL
jgi:hypothetical protein